MKRATAFLVVMVWWSLMVTAHAGANWRQRPFDCTDSYDGIRPIKCYGCVVAATTGLTAEEQHMVDLRDMGERHARRVEKLSTEYEHKLQLERKETEKYKELYHLARSQATMRCEPEL